MLFSSVTFLFVFMPSLLFCYFIVPKKLREVRNLILLLFSLAFYGYGGPRFLLLMLVSIAVNYLGGLLVQDSEGNKRKGVVMLTVAVNLGILGWFKYSGFIAVNLAAVGIPLIVPEVVLPIGISFFTFQGLSYVLDVYQGSVAVQRNPLRIALYISLFPQLIAGPIVRYKTVAQSISHRNENLTDFAEGGIRFLFGFSKKILLANTLGQIVAAAFDNPVSELSIAMAWLGALAYGGQIYLDFSGYSDMAIGLGRMFGFHFLENFNYPYIARSTAEFWRRWHISLSAWFRDYLYIPLGGSRCSKRRHILNILLVWTLTGLWHGAKWNFLLWGLYYGLLLLGEKYLWGQYLQKLPKAMQHFITLLMFTFSFVLFRAENLKNTFSYLAAMLGFGGNLPLVDGQAVYYLIQFRWELLVALAACLPIKIWLLTYLKNRQDKVVFQAVLVYGPPLLAIGLGALSLLYLVGSDFNPFIYFQF